MSSVSSAEGLYDALMSVQSQQQTLSNYSLNRGMDSFQKGNYEGAVQDFKRVIAGRPDYIDAYNFLAQAYLKLGKTNDAINTYQAAIRLQPGSADEYNKLGDAYLQSNQSDNAEKAYKTSMRLDPTDNYAPYNLGNLYVQNSQYDDAEAMFKKVISVSPSDPNGYYALGMTYNKMGRYDEAVTQLEKATDMKRTFAAAYYELGVAYSGLNDSVNAKRQVTALKGLDTNLYLDLKQTIEKPQIIKQVDYLSTFNAYFGAGTPVWLLDPSLMTPNASKDFTMTFQFSKDMDISSIINPVNWSIKRGTGGEEGYYANGIVPDTDVSVPPLPKMVTYNTLTDEATLTFSIAQNSAGNGTIDPSHLVFQFLGKDAEGKAMDPAGDQFDGYERTSF